MPITIPDLLTPDTCPDGFVVPRLAGIAKLAFEVKPSTDPEKYGPSQSFILQNQDGEIMCQLKGDAKTTWVSPPIVKGDSIEIFSTPHGKTGVPSGNKLRSYEKQGKKNRVLDVFGGRHYKNLTRTSDIQQAGIAAAREAAIPSSSTTPAPSTSRGGYTPREPVFGEIEACETYWRIFERMASKFVERFSTVTTFEAFMIEASEGVLDVVHKATTVIYLGMQDGKVRPLPPSRKETKE